MTSHNIFSMATLPIYVLLLSGGQHLNASNGRLWGDIHDDPLNVHFPFECEHCKENIEIRICVNATLQKSSKTKLIGSHDAIGDTQKVYRDERDLLPKMNDKIKCWDVTVRKKKVKWVDSDAFRHRADLNEAKSRRHRSKSSLLSECRQRTLLPLALPDLLYGRYF